MALVFVTTIFTILFAFALSASVVGLTTPEIIKSNGYVVETHKVTTDDGYILTLHRIPYGVDGDSTTKRPAVFFMHGLMSSSADFINMASNDSLAFILADAGYDVWLANARGTSYSREHITLDPINDAAQFFNFSWHEIGYYDNAASIDYILGVNGDDSLSFIGHSQGCATFLVLASTRPEYNAKIRIASLMAPGAFVEHRPVDLLSEIGKYVELFDSIMQRYEIYEIPFVDSYREWSQTACVNPENQDQCVQAFAFLGNDISNGEIDPEMIPVITTNLPNNAAMKQVIHYAQLMKYGGFTQFNYGPEKNLEIYGSETPPAYDLSQISAPVAIYYAKEDQNADYLDVVNLVSKIPNLANDYVVPLDSFTHINFLYAKDAVLVVYNELLRVMKKY